MPRTAALADSDPSPPRRGWLRPLAAALLGAAVAVGAYAVIDASSSSDGPRAAAPTTASASTTLAPPVAVKVYRTIQPSLVLIRSQTGAGADELSSLGSGVIVNKSGEIVTAQHVVDGATSIEVTFADGTRTAASVISSTPKQDIAVLQPEQLPSVTVPAVLGGGVQVGDDTFSLGNPLGLADSMTAGVVSGLDRSIDREDGSGELEGLIQFDAAVNPGSSGGPLLNRQGQVVGIVTALANPTGQRFFVGIGFAVPIASAGGGGRIPPS